MENSMKKIICIFLALCLCFSMAGCNGNGGSGTEPDVPEKPSQGELQQQAFEKADEYVGRMTLEEKIGQMFLMDADRLVEGSGSVTEASPELLEKIQRYKIGGVVFGAQNIQSAQQITGLTGQVRQSVEAAAAVSGGAVVIPLYIGTEEEGGGDNSIAAGTDTITSTGYVSPAEMGENMTVTQLQNTGEVIAAELDGLGFNLNFAPAADVAQEGIPVAERTVSEGVRSVVGEKPQYTNKPGKKLSKSKQKKKWKAYQSKLKEYNKKYKACMEAYAEQNYNAGCFGTDQDKVGEAVAAIITGMHKGKENGICTVLKMFPGISAVARYHRLAEREIDTGLSKLRRENLAPFAAGIDAGTDFIMVGHVIVSKVDEETPASLSKTILTDMLRDEMGFNGIILTEQLDVPVITNRYTTKQAVVAAVQAGADMIYNPDDLEVAISSVQQAVIAGEIEENVIDQAVLRILQNKFLRGIWKEA